ncbi:MAG: EF-hand domain-containing protein [Candidatus Sericytochromatia bacterium]
MLNKIFPLALILGLGLTAPAWSQPRGENFGKIDLNRDGKVTLLEMQTISRERFKKADTNNDGFITTDEVLELMPFFVRGQARQPVADYLKRQDSNKDGKVSLEEVLKHAALRFKRIDTNKDNALTEAEFKAIAGKMEM